MNETFIPHSDQVIQAHVINEQKIAPSQNLTQLPDLRLASHNWLAAPTWATWNT